MGHEIVRIESRTPATGGRLTGFRAEQELTLCYADGCRDTRTITEVKVTEDRYRAWVCGISEPVIDMQIYQH